ncbi:MAG: hypothetical protein KKE50_07280 [Nanoarchaeota archaeon]|nr:hypothetical protein [Nanoarchaeota archaeon]
MCNKTPLNKAFQLLAVVVLIVGVWYHDLTIIIAAAIVCLIGYLAQVLSAKKSKEADKTLMKKRR